ncbi:tyrosine-type recombinase/integrase [Halobacterium sp. MBLA0001]|uniref:tyrosine-type recombinase/integrase n=1 Tax=Halobacterium TaxID=2239 RepID=UPI0025564D0A|nr:site-specific integrase [Halobacterium salinarum]
MSSSHERPNWKGETERTYQKSLDTFLSYAEDVGIETVSDLTRWNVGNYTDWLLAYELDDGSHYAKVTVESKQKQARRWLKWLESQGLVESGLHVSIETLKLEDHEYSRDDILDPDDIRELLVVYRNSTEWRGTRRHALLEVIAHVGARRKGIRALDLSDWNPDERILAFANRPDTGTRLKLGRKHARKVVLSPEPAAAVDEYIARDRYSKRDEHGRKPLFSSRQGRPSESTITNWMYRATVPCISERCPHSRERHNCEWAHQQTKASQCPSSSSPHPARHGSITWQLNIGRSVEKVANRAGTTPGVIRRYYDQPDLDAELRRRITDFDGIDICKHEDPTDVDSEVGDE